MKYLILCPFFFSGFVSLFSQNLAAWYPFDGTADDATGNEHHGMTIGATLTTDRFGNENSAYYFDGNNDYIIVNDHADLRLACDFSISLWVRVEEYSNPNSFALLSKRNGGSQNGYLQQIIGFNQNQNLTFKTVTFITSSASDPIIKSTGEIQENEWFHIVLTHNQQTDLTQIYINGELNAAAIHPTPNATTDAELWIGRDPLSQFNNLNFEGDLDDIRIYKNELTDEEVKEIYDGLNSFSLGEDEIICEGDTLEVDLSDWNFTEILWSNGSSTPNFQITETGLYWVEVTLGNEITTDSIFVQLANCNQDTATFILSQDSIFCLDETVILELPFSNVSNIQWQDGSQESTFFATTAGKYNVIFEYENSIYRGEINLILENCTFEILIPNAFTPNEDGVNDIFRPIEISNSPFVANMKIYNRWGNLIFNKEGIPSNQIASFWDGKFENKLLAADVYIYVITIYFSDNSSKLFTGEITLIL